MLAAARDRPAAWDSGGKPGKFASEPPLVPARDRRAQQRHGAMTQCMTIFLDAKTPIREPHTRGDLRVLSLILLVFSRVEKAGLTDAQHRFKLGPLHTSAACISVNSIICR